ncbi:hypothetical protein ACO0SA_000104 [Hanseniaspora valbyensis]
MAITNLFTPKHQRLVTQCYPKGKKTSEKQPKSSELSYLIYYCNTRRTKLTKVSTFLKKKAAKDVSSKKIGDIYVTIIILCKIIINCKENLGIIFDDFMSIIFDILKQPVFKKDDYILEGIVQFFESLSLNLDYGFISNTQINQFQKFLQIYFHELISKNVKNLDSLQRQRLLRGCVVLPKIKCVKHLEFFREFLYESIYKTLKIYQINNENINVKCLGEENKQFEKESDECLEKYDPKLGINADASAERLSRRLTHVRSDSEFLSRASFEKTSEDANKGIMPVGLDDMDPNDYSDDLEKKLTLETLKNYFNSDESDLLPLSIKALNTVMVELPNVNYYKFIISGIPVQLRYISILITVNGIINSQIIKDSEQSIYSDNNKATILLKIISDLILSEVSIVALSVVDIVKKLINYQISFAINNKSYNSADDELMKQIPHTISILNTRTFYKDQLNDILHEILNLIEVYADGKDDSKAVLDILYNDMSLIISYLDKSQNQISLSLFNDVTMIVRDNLTRSNYIKLFDITLNSKDLNNQTCMTFFESLRQLISFFDNGLTEHILSTALENFRSSILLSGLSFYKMTQQDGEPVSKDYFVYHLQAAKFLKIKDYENKVYSLIKENRYFTTNELLNYYSDENLNPYSIKGSKILSDSSVESNGFIQNDPEAQAKEDEIIYNMMNTSLQNLDIPQASSITRHFDVKSLTALQNGNNYNDKPSVNELKSLINNNGKGSAVNKLKRNDTMASQSVKSKVTNITFLLSELQDSSKNLKIRMPNEDQVSQLDERIIKQNKLSRNSFKRGKKSFENSDRLSLTFGNSNRLSTTNSNNSISKTVPNHVRNGSNSEFIDIKNFKYENEKEEDDEDDDDFNFVDASSDVSSIGELDNRGNLFV